MEYTLRGMAERKYAPRMYLQRSAFFSAFILHASKQISLVVFFFFLLFLLRVRPALRGGRSLSFSFLFRCGAGEAFCFGVLAVEFEEAGEDFVAEIVGPAVAPGFFAAAGGVVLFVLLFLVIQQELTHGLQVRPASRSSTARSMAACNSCNRRMSGDCSPIVEPVVGLGQPSLLRTISAARNS